jgi:cytoskeletal protein CcmA (bactofilin family)
MSGSGGWNWAGGLLALVTVSAVAASCRAPAALDEEGIRVRRGGDLVSARATVAIRDSVDGDVMMAGRDLLFTGVAGGDVLAAGAWQRLGGTVTGSLRAAGVDLRIAARVGRNVTAAGRSVAVERSGRIAGNSYLVGRAVRLDGGAEGLVRIAARDVAIGGTVAGDMLIESVTLLVGPDAVIEGDLRYRLRRGEEPRIDPSARIEGTVHPQSPRPRFPVRILLRVLALVGFLVAGAVVVAILPGLALAGERRIRGRPLASLGELVGAFLIGGLIIGLLGLIPIAGPIVVAVAAVLGLEASRSRSGRGRWRCDSALRSPVDTFPRGQALCLPRSTDLETPCRSSLPYPSRWTPSGAARWR